MAARYRRRIRARGGGEADSRQQLVDRFGAVGGLGGIPTVDAEQAILAALVGDHGDAAAHRAPRSLEWWPGPELRGPASPLHEPSAWSRVRASTTFSTAPRRVAYTARYVATIPITAAPNAP